MAQNWRKRRTCQFRSQRFTSGVINIQKSDLCALPGKRPDHGRSDPGRTARNQDGTIAQTGIDRQIVCEYHGSRILHHDFTTLPQSRRHGARQDFSSDVLQQLWPSHTPR